MKTLIVTVAASLILFLPITKPATGLASLSTIKANHAATTKLASGTQNKVKLAAAIAPGKAQPATPQSQPAPAAPAKQPAIGAATPSQPAPSQPAAVNGCANYTSLFAQYAWDVHTALAICQAESGGIVTAVSPTLDYGLMQVSHVHADMVSFNLAALFDPATNIRVAYQIYTGSGWHAWTTYNDGAYARYL